MQLRANFAFLVYLSRGIDTFSARLYLAYLRFALSISGHNLHIFALSGAPKPRFRTKPNHVSHFGVPEGHLNVSGGAACGIAVGE